MAEATNASELMALTRHASSEEAKRYDHGINIRRVYVDVLNARWAEMFRGDLPDDSELAGWQKTLDRLTPPLPLMAKKHAIAAYRIARWRRAAGL